MKIEYKSKNGVYECLNVSDARLISTNASEYRQEVSLHGRTADELRVALTNGLAQIPVTTLEAVEYALETVKRARNLARVENAPQVNYLSDAVLLLACVIDEIKTPAPERVKAVDEVATDA